MEEWRDIKGYEGMYQVSNLGQVKSLERWTHFKNGKKPRLEKERILKLVTHHKGYFKAQLRKNDKMKAYFVHRLVAEAFIPNPEGKSQVNHKDGIKTNNKTTNLEWVTQSENLKHSYHILGVHKKSVEAMHAPRIKAKSKPVDVYDSDGNLIREYSSQASAAKDLGVSAGNINNVVKRRGSYKSLKGYVFRYKGDTF